MKSFRWTYLTLLCAASVGLLAGCGDSVAPTAAVPELDTTPPPAPAQVSYMGVGTGRLIWEASAAPDVASYQVYLYSPSPDRDNAYVQVNDPDPTDTRFDLPQTTLDQPAIYRIRAVDQAGNRSAFSAAISVYLGPLNGGGNHTPGGDGNPQPMED